MSDTASYRLQHQRRGGELGEAHPVRFSVLDSAKRAAAEWWIEAGFGTLVNEGEKILIWEDSGSKPRIAAEYLGEKRSEGAGSPQ